MLNEQKIGTLGQFSELGAFRTFVYEPFPITKVVAPSVSIIANAFHSLWKSIIVLNMACQLTRVMVRRNGAPRRTASSAPLVMTMDRWSSQESSAVVTKTVGVAVVISSAANPEKGTFRTEKKENNSRNAVVPVQAIQAMRVYVRLDIDMPLQLAV